MRIAKNHNPVAVYNYDAGVHITVVRGMEFADDHPIVRDRANAWLFVEDAPVEAASAAPGERRSLRKA